MILFLRSSDIGIDARLRRYVRALAQGGLRPAALFWDRDGKALGLAEVHEVRFRAPRAHGLRWLMALRLLLLNLFAILRIWHMRHGVSLVHAVDLDTALAAWIGGRITGLPFIYDIYDHYPDSRGISGRARRLCDWLEARVIAAARLVILADPARVAQHGAIPADKLLIVENVPDLPPSAAAPRPPGGPLRLGYLGTLEAQWRGLEDTIAVVRDMPDVELEIAGTGAIEREVRQAASDCPRIRFHGPLPHGEGLRLMASCDMLLGLYYLAVPNHRFAAPNKYYEHLALARPLLTSLGTPPGDKVRADGSGWAVGDSRAEIRAALEEAVAHRDLVAERGRRAGALWQQNYASYFERAIAGDYVDAVKAARRA